MVPCIQIDLRSKREYARGYIEELLQRIEQLKDVVNVAPPDHEAQEGMGPNAPLMYHGEDSITSMARLVEAAVGDQVSTTSLSDIEMDMARERENAVRIQTYPAEFPSRDTAQQLFASYLNGLHLLHPFLHRSTLLRELNDAYTRPEALNTPAMFRINMVFAIGSVALVRAGLHSIPPMNYYAAAMQHRDKCLGLSALEHIQGLLLILLFSLQHDISIGSKWDLSRVAMRICVENRLHKKNPQAIDLAEEQMRRRVFWACYISDRHSSSVLGKPMAIQDADIEAELPIDADDDLITTGNIDGQMLRGMSEVSAQLRQIQLRRITSKIGTLLYRKAANWQDSDPAKMVDEIIDELDQWRRRFPIVSQPHNVYESIQWRDLNYFRECLKCFRVLALQSPEYGTSYLDRVTEAASQVVMLYQAMRTKDNLILNWTCVHDMMSAGFTNLYCGIARRDVARNDNMTACSWQEKWSTIHSTTLAVIEVLSYIADKWPTATTHVRVFEALATKVAHSMEPTLLGTSNIVLRPTAAVRPSGLEDAGSWDADFGRYAEMWDAALAAFLDEPLDLGNIDWGAVDWDAMQVFSDDQQQR
ncbi:fungal-specific transcription factor domain-containing protein [Aspergillus insuetus]